MADPSVRGLVSVRATPSALCWPRCATCDREVSGSSDEAGEAWLCQGCGATAPFCPHVGCNLLVGHEGEHENLLGERWPGTPEPPRRPFGPTVTQALTLAAIHLGHEASAIRSAGHLEEAAEYRRAAELVRELRQRGVADVPFDVGVVHATPVPKGGERG